MENNYIGASYMYMYPNKNINPKYHVPYLNQSITIKQKIIELV